MGAILPKQVLAAIFLLVAGCGCSHSSTQNPHPPSSQPAVTLLGEILLVEGWSFFRFAPDEVFDPASLPETGWVQVLLPHTAKIEPRIVTDQWQGDALYKRGLFAPREWEGKAIWLRFEGAMMVAHVYLNGKRILEHRGGYLPFTIDLSSKLRFGENNHILIHLDNRDNALIGPKPLAMLDFNYFGGLYREVRLFVRDSLHITDEILANRRASGGIFVTYPRVSRESARVSVKTHIANQGETARQFTVVHTLMDGGHAVKSSTSRGIVVGRQGRH